MDNFSRLFAVFQSSTHKSVNLKRPFHSFIVNICQYSGAVIAVTGESRGPAMASQLHRFGNVKAYRPFHSGCGSQQVHIFLGCNSFPLQPSGSRANPSPRPMPCQASAPATADNLVQGGSPGSPGEEEGGGGPGDGGDLSPAAPHNTPIPSAQESSRGTRKRLAPPLPPSLIFIPPFNY